MPGSSVRDFTDLVTDVVTDGEWRGRLVANGEVMQALQTLRRAAEGGPRSLRRLCERIAARVAENPEYASVRKVQIVRERYDPIAYFERGPAPEEREVLRRCNVARKE